MYDRKVGKTSQDGETMWVGAGGCKGGVVVVGGGGWWGRVLGGHDGGGRSGRGGGGRFINQRRFLYCWLSFFVTLSSCKTYTSNTTLW